MATTEGIVKEKDNTRLIMFAVIGIIAALVIAGLFYLKRQPDTGAVAQQRLENALRPGSPEFPQLREKITLDKPEADEGKRAIGDWVMTLHTTVRNFTGRTIDGLEMYAAVVDLQGKPVKERTFIVIPARQPELGPNKTMPVQVTLEGMKDADTRADIKMEITAIRVK